MYWVWALSGPKELIPDVASALLGLSLVFKPPSRHIRPFLSCLVCGFWLTLFTFPLCLLPPSLLSEAELCVTHRCYKNWSKNEASLVPLAPLPPLPTSFLKWHFNTKHPFQNLTGTFLRLSGISIQCSNWREIPERD